jgi:hypothetical protein
VSSESPRVVSCIFNVSQINLHVKNFIDVFENSRHIKSMKKTPRGRPPKKKSERKDKDLRIPVTAAQRDLANGAAAKIGLDFAEWARGILLREAQQIMAQHETATS